MFNTNFAHNIMNWLIAILGGLEAFMLMTGCTTTIGGQLECSLSWLPQFITPAGLAFALMVLGLVKSLINVVRDGFGGLLKQQPPVADQMKTVVLTSPADTSVSVSSSGGAVTEMKKT